MNYKKLLDDVKNGKIDKDAMLIMDNDGGYWSCGEDEEKEKLLRKTYGEPNGYRDIVDVLQAAGVNCDWC